MDSYDFVKRIYTKLTNSGWKTKKLYDNGEFFSAEIEKNGEERILEGEKNNQILWISDDYMIVIPYNIDTIVEVRFDGSAYAYDVDTAVDKFYKMIDDGEIFQLSIYL